MRSTVRIDDVLEQLMALMAVKGEAPHDASSCPELIQYVAERLPQFSKHATSIAWLLIVEAVSVEEPPTARHRPLLAARHLLAQGRYPDDIIRDCGQPLASILKSSPVSTNSDPSAGITLRRKIATLAGRFGGSPSNLQPHHKSRKLLRIARALWDSIQERTSDPDVLARLEASLESARKGPDASRDIAIRRLRRMRRQRLLSKTTRYVYKNFGKLSLRAFMAGLVVLLVYTYIALDNPDNDPAVDPLSAQRAGESWEPRSGPSNAKRTVATLNGLEMNPRVERNPMLYLLPSPNEDRLTVDGNFGEYENFRDLVPGDYVVTLRVIVVRDGHTTWSGQNTSGARVQFGILLARGVAASHSLYARLSADEMATVWEGESLVVSCNCTVELDETSLRLFSDAVPEGVSLSPTASNSSVPIGYEGPDGILHSGRTDVVKVTATIKVREREW